MAQAKNVVVAQSGGPTPVINSTLRGIVEACKGMPDKFGAIYAGFHGIEGVLKEELLDMSAQPDEEIALLSITPPPGASAPAATSSSRISKRTLSVWSKSSRPTT